MLINKKAINVLQLAVTELPKLLSSKEWQSYYIDAEEPIVERLWHKISLDDWRICLHRIQPSTKAFYHPHRHPTAILICKGSYEMGVGYGNPDGEPPPVFGPILLKEWNSYQMADPNNWHYIKTIEGPSYSIMVTGKPYQVDRLVQRPRPRQLTNEESDRIFKFFDSDIIQKATSSLKDIVASTSVNLGVN